MRHTGGLTILLTGLSGAGKTTVATALCDRLRDADLRQVRLLDGDVLRREISSDLGFSREDRDAHLHRVGRLAAEITGSGAIAVCAVIAPYEAARASIRMMVEAVGSFVLVHVATPLAVCEQRDAKGLYAKARAGQLPMFTGISDPYEVPAAPDIVIDTSQMTVEEAVEHIFSGLERNVGGE
jgi:sulfate adenylyltransferase